jgi:hypothetical protein
MTSHSATERFSPLVLARVAGILMLAGIATGAFDIGYVQSKLIVLSDPAATLRNIAAHPTLFRMGFSAHLLELVINIPNEIIFFLLLRRVNVVLAAIALGAGFVGITVEAVDMLSGWAPLQLALGGTALAAFTPAQVLSLSDTAAAFERAGLLMCWVFYGMDEILTGYLIFRSRFLPRILGLLLTLAGLCYFTDGFVSFLSPNLYAHLNPYILYPCAPGEGLIALWLAIMGLNVIKWRAWSDGSRTVAEPSVSP